MHKYIMVQGIKGKLVAVSSGARAYVAQEAVPREFDEETQQFKLRAERADDFKPTKLCVVFHRAYAKAVRKGMLKQYGEIVAASSAKEAETKLKSAKLYTPPGKRWDGDKLVHKDHKAPTAKPSGKGGSK